MILARTLSLGCVACSSASAQTGGLWLYEGQPIPAAGLPPQYATVSSIRSVSAQSQAGISAHVDVSNGQDTLSTILLRVGSQTSLVVSEGTLHAMGVLSVRFEDTFAINSLGNVALSPMLTQSTLGPTLRDLGQSDGLYFGASLRLQTGAAVAGASVPLDLDVSSSLFAN